MTGELYYSGVEKTYPSEEEIQAKRAQVAENIFTMRRATRFPLKKRIKDIKKMIELSGFKPKSFNLSGKTIDEVAGSPPNLSGLSAFGQGVLSEVDRYVAGAKQIATDDPERLKQIAQEREAVERRTAQMKSYRPGMTFAGQAFPYLVVPARTMLQAVTSGTALGATEYADKPYQRPINTLTGGSLGLFGNVVSRVLLKPFEKPKSFLSPEQQKVLNFWKKNFDMEFSPGQSTGSRVKAGVESALESHPLTAGESQVRQLKQQKIINRVAAKSIGQDSEYLTADVLKAANADLSNVFDRIYDTDRVFKFPKARAVTKKDSVAANIIEPELGGTPVSPAETEISARLRTYMSATGMTPDDVFKLPVMQKLVRGIGQRGEITSQEWKQIRREFNTAITYNLTSDKGVREFGFALSDVRNIAEKYIKKQLSGKEQADLAKANRQYSNLLTLIGNRGKDNRVVNEVTGNVSAVKLATQLTKDDFKGMKMNAGDRAEDNLLYQIGKLGKAFANIGDSGTATRSSVMATATPAAVAGAGTFAATGDVVAAAGAATLPGALMYGSGKIYTAPWIDQALKSGLLTKKQAENIRRITTQGMFSLKESVEEQIEERFAP